MHLEALEESRRYADTIQTVNRENRIFNEEDLFYANQAVVSSVPNLLAIDGNHVRRMLAIGAPVQPSISTVSGLSSNIFSSPNDCLPMTSAQAMRQTPSAPPNSQISLPLNTGSLISVSESQQKDKASDDHHNELEEEIDQLSQRTQSQLSIVDGEKNNEFSLDEQEVFINKPVVDEEIVTSYAKTFADSNQFKEIDIEVSQLRGKKRKATDDNDSEDDDILVAAEKSLEKNQCRSSINDLVDTSTSAGVASTRNKIIALRKDPYENRMVHIPTTSQAITVIGNCNTTNQDLSKQKKRPKLQNPEVASCRMCEATVEWYDFFFIIM